MRRVMSLLFVAAVVAALPAQAQAPDEEPPHILPFEVYVGGGYTYSLSGVRQYLGDGYHIDTGLTLLLKPTLGLQVEYGYTGLGSKQVTVPGTSPEGVTVRPITATMHMQYVNFNLVTKPRTASRAKPYVITGVGVYYRPVKVTTPVAGYVPGYCYPYYYACWPGGVVVQDQVLASATTTGFGINIGGGLFVLMSREAGGGFYIESRYHYMWGPELKNSQGGSAGKANGQFLPVTIGLRF